MPKLNTIDENKGEHISFEVVVLVAVARNLVLEEGKY